AKRLERLAARWAPLRHRCHAWQRTTTRPEELGALDESVPSDPDPGVPWTYRICFLTEAMAWAPKPWLERQDLGWYDKSKDEEHPN
ncbi:unnamed protein product, partial [Polarella glacialis]